MRDIALVFSCEHAMNCVPARFRGLFVDCPELLQSHRGYDPGALDLAELLSQTFQTSLFVGEVTRLLVDHNRSPSNRNLWSVISRKLDSTEKKALLHNYYEPFRRAVAAEIATLIESGKTVVHLSVHSFVPVLDDKERRADIGLLYDSRSEPEKTLGKLWQDRLRKENPALRIRLNYPYRGRSDGHQTTYRNQYPPQAYLGLELEVNQAMVGSQHWLETKMNLVGTLKTALQLFVSGSSIHVQGSL